MAIMEAVDENVGIESLDPAFSALAPEPRRQIFISLAESQPERELSVPEVANPPFMLQDPDELAVELVHEHLPVLEDGDYVEPFRKALVVRRTPPFDAFAVAVESLLTCVDDVPDQLVGGDQRLEEAQRTRAG